jgi:hypothetical protein
VATPRAYGTIKVMENKPTTTAGTPTENSIGMRGFNRTGREETTTQVLRPQRDPTLLRRNIALIAVAVVAFLFVGYMAFERSGLKFSDIWKTDEQQKSFGTQAEQQDRKYDQ